LHIPSLDQLRRNLKPGDSTLEQNAWNLYLEIAFYGFMFGIVQTFLNVYAIRLGASNEVLGLLSAAPPFVFAVGAIPAARLVERTQRQMPFILATSGVYRVGVAFLGLMPFVLSTHRAEAMVVIVLVMSIPQIMSSISFSSMFADLVPTGSRAKVVAVRNTLLGLTSSLASFLGGQYLGISLAGSDSPLAPLFTFPLNYQILFLTCFAASLAGMYYLGRVRTSDHLAPLPQPGPRDQRPFRTRLQSFIRLMLSQQDFSRYTAAMFIMHWGVYLPVPLYSIFWVRTLHASDSFVGLILTVQGIATMLVYPILPRVNNRLGSRGLVALSLVLTALYPLGTAFVTTLEPLLLIAVLGGVGGGMFNLGTFNLLLEVAPQERRPSFLATFNTAVFSAGCVAPFIGTALLAVIDIRQDLLFGFALRLAGFVAFLLMVGLSSKAKPSTV
jgi:MFS family permease